MKIGELAKRAEVPIDTVRYYEREGLIPPPVRRASGYRDYLDRLRFMRRAKGLGFTLHEIRELLSLTTMSGDDMAALNAQTQAKLRDVEDRIHSLTRIREALQSSPADWRPGDKVIIPPSVSNDEANRLFPQGWDQLHPYLRLTRL